MRIAMWSGPRNLSTAMMYSFAARDDCAVWDEPFYAAYLAATGLEHPMRDEILAAGEQDHRKVAKKCLSAIPEGKSLFYQKHMTQHMIPEFDKGWLAGVKNVFLIRHPAKVMASYLVKREGSTLNDIGFWQQETLFDQVAESIGETPVVIDSDDILKDPKAALKGLCGAIDIDFQPQMLRWPKGPNENDGAWAPHWYKSVWQSTGFSQKPVSGPDISGLNKEILAKAMQSYQKLRQYRI
ncbi:MAG: HAD family hydrolase [Rhodobacteraceae bacterium]|nr:HAD family hydrolase [Paracoccaceae bacterium]